MDVGLASAMLLALSPLLALVAVKIKLDSRGPVIFRQRRNGFSGCQFAIYEFRTMNVLDDGAVISQAKQRDRRVTAVGRLLRRFGHTFQHSVVPADIELVARNLLR
jgi:undecaprenyl-phosphate galactose phosphotransferase/putative colanic acid biosynthesis UDP-glucose lipid carrier transferase